MTILTSPDRTRFAPESSLKAGELGSTSPGVHNETLTNVFWGLLLIWFGLSAATLHGDLGATINDPTFGLGTGVLLLVMNLTRSLLHLRLSVLTIGLGALLTIFYAPVLLLDYKIPFLPAILVIAGLALIIGAFRTRNFQAY